MTHFNKLHLQASDQRRHTGVQRCPEGPQRRDCQPAEEESLCARRQGHSCQMAIAKFLDCMRLALRA